MALLLVVGLLGADPGYGLLPRVTSAESPAPVQPRSQRPGPRIKIVTPRPDAELTDPLVVQALVRARDGTRVDRVEAWVNGRALGSLEAPPFRWTTPRPGDGGPVTVRVEAEDGTGATSTAEVVLAAGADASFRAEVPAVAVNLAVVDERGRPVGDLAVDEITVWDDDEPQEIDDLIRRDAPLEVVLLVDRSASMADAMPRVRRAVEVFLDLLGAEDRVKLIGFNDRVTSYTPFTQEHRLVAAFASGIEAEGSTALNDAVLYAYRQLGGDDTQRRRRAILLLTDGRDRRSRRPLEPVLEATRRAGVALYAVGQGEALEDEDLRGVLEEASRRTGGEASFPEDPDRLEGVFRDLARSMRSLFLLTYRPTDPTPGWHRIEVDVHRPGVVVRHRAGYVREDGGTRP